MFCLKKKNNGIGMQKKIASVHLDLSDGDGANEEEDINESANEIDNDEEIRDEEVTEQSVRDEGHGFSEGEQSVRDVRQSCKRHPPTWMGEYVSGEGLSEDEAFMALGVSTDPICFEDVVQNENWRLAMDNEIKSIEKNKTWTLIELPSGAKRIGVKWVYKTKYNEHGKVDKNKARLVAKGYSQQHEIDYTKVFAPVARMDTIRMIVALAAQKDWKIFQLDVKSAFLHGELNEDVYVEQPKGYQKKEKEHLVFKLHKALYGLKQAPRAWFSRIEAHFLNEGFQSCNSEQTLFTKRSMEGKIIIFVPVKEFG
ncbi:retrovirus-related Pol polyprotein from transposon TNT 1-94 [Cucumis melo var. makuwa]|uniref:Retrovirus-related Pol polyprotein from transposon TNT 1-94 n=1 Tax=Cucumis melo var. makuwa TaxID=1194695 RepID=A0A5A7SSH2_CUCMM|nr:retrovirus-related Pol polyprotein from transposon TNT 1-94 [Cucumis melo var. makuwa]